MEKTTPQLPSSSSSSSEVKVKVEPQLERNTVFNSQVGQPGVTHIWNDAQLPFNFCQFEQPFGTHIWNDDQLPFAGSVPAGPQHNFCQFEQPFGIHIWNDDQLQFAGLVLGGPQHNFCQHDDLPVELVQKLHLQVQQVRQRQPCVIPKHTFQAPQFLGSTCQVLRPHLDSHINDGVISRKRSQEWLSQVGELASGSRTNKMRFTHSAEAQVQLGGVPGTRQQRFSQILEEFDSKFEEGMIKMEERMTKFEERMTKVEEGMAIVSQLVDIILVLEKKLENLACIRSKDTGNTTTVVEEKLTNLTISDTKSKVGSTSGQEGYTCGEDFVLHR